VFTNVKHAFILVKFQNATILVVIVEKARAFSEKAFYPDQNYLYQWFYVAKSLK
jgi:hypothetical protein